MSLKIFDNHLVAIRKNKFTLKLNKPAYVYVGMCILKLNEVLMYAFHYDYIKNKYDKKSKLLFTDTDSLMYEIKTEDVYEHFSSNSESKYYDNWRKLVIGKRKDETRGVAIEEFVGLKQKMYSFLVDNSKQEKLKDVNENSVATISRNE